MTSKTSLPAPIQADPANPTKFERLTDLAAGQYWKSTKNAPGRKATFHRHGEDGIETDGRVALKKGVTLLVKSIRWIDGDMHTIITAPHPLENDAGYERRFLTTEFFRYFERDTDYKMTRALEIDEVQGQIRTLQTELIAGPADIPLLSAPTSIPTMGSLIEHAHAADDIKSKALAAVEVTKKRADWVQAKVGELAAQTTLLAAFHQETASAAIASAEDTLRYARHLESGIKTLGIYTGEGVKLFPITTGAPAPDDQPVTIYQRKLFFDEELAIHARDGGADADDFADFGAALKADPTLVQRIMPAQKSIVLMRYRRHDKHYFSKKGQMTGADVLANMFANEKNKTTFLLIRNGENISFVFSSVTTDHAIRLFPTQQEIEDIYKQPGHFGFSGIDARKATLDELHFSDRRQEHDNVALFYKRMLIMLWGLSDRAQVFGQFYDRTEWPTWLDQNFQKTFFRFVTDDENALTVDRPAYHAWLAAKNSLAQAGSRIIGYWPDLFTPETAPAACKWIGGFGHKSEIFYTYRPIEKTGFAILKTKGSDLIAQIPCKYDGYREVQREKIEASLSIGALANNWTAKQGAYLCLDAVSVEDLTYYINSRKERESYLDYIDLFVEARKHLRGEEDQAKPFVSAILDGLAAACVVDRLQGANDDRQSQILSAVHEAVRLWRANRYGRAVPAPGEKDWKEVLGQIGRQVYLLLGIAGEPADDLTALVQKAGRTPLLHVSEGNGKTYVYASLTPEEEFDWKSPLPWAAKLKIVQSKAAGLTLSAPVYEALPEKASNQHVLHVWPAANAWRKKHGTTSLDYRKIKNMAESFGRAADAFKMLLERGPIDQDTFKRVFQTFRYKAMNFSHKKIIRPDYIFPVAACVVHDTAKKAQYTRFVFVETDLLNYLWARTTADQQQEIIKWVRTSYSHPHHTLDRLKERVPGQNRECLNFFTMDLQSALDFVPDLEKAGYINQAPIYRRGLRGRITASDLVSIIAKSEQSFEAFAPKAMQGASFKGAFLDWDKSILGKLGQLLDIWPILKDDEDTESDEGEIDGSDTGGGEAERDADVDTHQADEDNA